MVSHSDLATNFSNGATKGKGSRMFIKGDTIYSYGIHFPIAIRTKWGYIFNSEGYSSSTANHKRHVLGSLSGVIVHCMVCELRFWDKQVGQNKNKIKSLLGKIDRARCSQIKDFYKRDITSLKEQNKLLKKYRAEDVVQEKKEADPMFKMVGMVAGLGEMFCDNQKEKNDWKVRMIKAGFENKGLIMPSDWDNLTEAEKETRLNGVIKQFNED